VGDGGTGRWREKKGTFVTTDSASDDCGQLPVPTFVGYLQTKEDALRLVEDVLCDILHHSFGGPQVVSSAVQSGHTFIWEQVTTEVQYWNDGISWTSIDRDDDFWISRETTTGHEPHEDDNKHFRSRTFPSSCILLRPIGH